jgi:hypothetical protein
MRCARLVRHAHQPRVLAATAHQPHDACEQ